MAIFEIAKNGIWSKKIFVKLIYLISRVFLGWTFLNFLAHCNSLKAQVLKNPKCLNWKSEWQIVFRRHLNWFLIKSCRYVQYIHNPLLRSIIQALLWCLICFRAHPSQSLCCNSSFPPTGFRSILFISRLVPDQQKFRHIVLKICLKIRTSILMYKKTWNLLKKELSGFKY